MSEPARNQLLATLILAALGWVPGYLINRLARPDGELMLPAPGWVKMLCGNPRRDGLLTPRATFAQIMGVVIAMSGFAVLFSDESVAARSIISAAPIYQLFGGLVSLTLFGRLVLRYSNDWPPTFPGYGRPNQHDRTNSRSSTQRSGRKRRKR